MADFKTHITASTVVGMGYGAGAYALFDVRPESCFIAAGLCSVAGILPDIDSESGNTVREITGFAAAVVPLMLLDRFAALGLSHELMVLAGGCLYIIMRFGLAALIAKITVHRGMWHSIPAALIAGLVTFWLCACPEPFPCLLKAGATTIGYLTHLVLDEVFSFELYRGRFRVKNSFGTALKIWSPNSMWSNTSVYALLITLCVFLFDDAASLRRLPWKSPMVQESQPDAHRHLTAPTSETRTHHQNWPNEPSTPFGDHDFAPVEEDSRGLHHRDLDETPIPAFPGDI